MKSKRLIQCLVAVCALLPPIKVFGGTSERVVTDRFSGVAISGFDPVAYFTDAGPREGRDEIETESDGAIWRFRNIGNRASFLAHPDIYAPKFGGYDPVDVARGVSRPGRPQIWLIVDGHLYLFAEEANRDAFEAMHETAGRAADEAWPAVEARLAR